MTQDTPFPLLSLIDVVRNPDAHPFATDPQAAALERRARQLTDEYWPDQVFLTGNISRPLLNAVALALEAERVALHDGIRLLVETQRAATTRA